jgi:hypothetical protein
MLLQLALQDIGQLTDIEADPRAFHAELEHVLATRAP